MIEACDPDANIDDLRALIKLNTGQDIQLTKKQICEVYDEIKAGKLPLPPLIMNSTKTYLIDKKSPLKIGDYEILFDSSSKRNEIKKVARKVGLKQLDQMTKGQMVDSIGKRLRYMKVHEPVKIGKKRVTKTLNSTAVNNNTAVGNVNELSTINNGLGTNNNGLGTINNGLGTNNNGLGTNNGRRNVNNGLGTNNGRRNVNNGLGTNTPISTPKSRVTFPKGGLFMKGQRPRFLNGQVSAVKTRVNVPDVFKTRVNVPYVFKEREVVVVPGPPRFPNAKPKPSVTIQKQEFMNMIVNVKLSDDDKRGFLKRINSKTNLNTLKNQAIKLYEQRKKEKESLVKQNLLSFLTPLKINQINKNAFLRRFNKGESINTLKREATAKQGESTRSGNVNVRTRLVQRLDEIKLNSLNKNVIMSRFNNGQKNVNKLVIEAKKLKTQRNVGKIASEKERLTALAKQLNVYTEFSRSISKLSILSAVDNIEKSIITSGTTKKGGIFAQKIQKLSTIAREMNLDADIKVSIINIKTNANVDAVKIRIIGSTKEKLYEKAKSLNAKYSRSIEKLQNVEKVVQLRNAINTATARKKIIDNKQKVELRTKRKREVKAYINQSKSLPQSKKNVFIKQLDINSTNLNQLRKNIDTAIQEFKSENRTNNINEFEQSLKPLDINKSKKNAFIQQFKNSKNSLTNIKASINKEVTEKGTIESKKRILAAKIATVKQYNVELNFNSSVSTITSENALKEINRKVDTAIDSKIDKTRNTLSNKIINAGVKNDFMNKITAIKTLKNMKNVSNQIDRAIASKSKSKKDEISVYMRRLGLTTQNIQTVLARNLDVEKSREMADDIIKNKQKSKLTNYLDEKKVPVSERTQFYNQTGNLRSIMRTIDQYMRSKRTEQPRNITNILNKYNLKNVDRQFILNEWNSYSEMTPENVENLASKRSDKFKKEKELALRSYLTNELELNSNEVSKIMQEFQLNPKNINSLRNKAKKIKGISGEKKRISERIRKAREGNKLNLDVVVNIKNMDNVKNIDNTINKAYINRDKKNIARRALNRNINISSNLNAIKSMNNVQRLKNKLNGLLTGKKKQDLRKLVNVMGDINKENQERFLKRFKNQNNSLGTLLENVKNFKNTQVNKKQAIQKQELYTYINEKLDLDVSDRSAIMLEFNTVKDLNKMKRKADTIKKQRKGAGIAENRKKLEEILRGINIENRDKKFILLRFNRKPGNINSFKANAEKLAEEKKGEMRKKELSELDTHMGRLGLSDENKQKIRTIFTQNSNKTLNSAKANATDIRRTRNQKKLENILINLKSLSENKKALFRSNLTKPNANVDTIIQEARTQNARIKNKKETNRNVNDFVLSLNIGEYGTKLISNFKGGLINGIKAREEAKKKRQSMNADIVVEKKKKLRTFMNKTLLDNVNKNRFINRVTLKENTSVLEKEITTLNKQMKGKTNTFATKQTTLQAFLNGLTDLTMEQKAKFMSQVTNAKTDIEPIKRRAQTIDKAKKKGIEKRKKRSATRNEANVRENWDASKAMNSLNKQRNLDNRMAKRNKVLSELSKQNDKRFMKLKTRAGDPFQTGEEFNRIALNVKKMVELVESEKRDRNKPFNASAELNKQLNIKGKELNKANTNKKIRNGVEFKIKQIEGLTNTNVPEFMKKWNATKNPFTRRGIFNQARKRGEGRLRGKKVKIERNKPKEQNNFNTSAAIDKLNMVPKKNRNMAKKTTTNFSRNNSFKKAEVMGGKTRVNPMFENNGEIQRKLAESKKKAKLAKNLKEAAVKATRDRIYRKLIESKKKANLAKNLKEAVAKAAASKMTNIERIKKSGEAAEAKRMVKAEQRKKNKQFAKTTGQSVKSTQKKQQMKRKSNPTKK